MSSARNKSVFNPDRKTINVGHLEREITRDVASYHKYRAEDGMKKRAVHTSEISNCDKMMIIFDVFGQSTSLSFYSTSNDIKPVPINLSLV